MGISVAIIGAGPGGFYAAEALIKAGIDCRIDLIERLPAPFGLIRSGVAPDHQTTKRVTRAYDRTARQQCVSYYGNVQIGRDVSLSELRDLYDAVILAVGAPLDRDLALPGADKTGVYGSAAFVGWYNGHPDFVDLDPDLSTEQVAVIGNGNVAIDVARVLVKTPAEMAASDLPDYAARAIHAAPIREVTMIGRRGPLEAKFTNVELREMGELEDAVPVVDPAQLPDAVAGDWSERDRRVREKNLATLKSFVGRKAGERRKRVRFLFYAAPIEILGGTRVTGLRLERTRVENGRARGTGECFDLPCGLVVASIGYRGIPLDGLPLEAGQGSVEHRDGRVAEGLYVVGWAKRGPTGVIGTNKADGDRVAQQIARDLTSGGKPGRGAFEALLRRRQVSWVDFDDWRAIDAAEIAAAPPQAPRKKLLCIKDMLEVLQKAGRSRTVA